MDASALTANPYTRSIARFVSGLRYDEIPAQVVHRIKLLILDSLGCAVYAADLPWSRILQARLTAIDTTRHDKLAPRALTPPRRTELRDAVMGLERLPGAAMIASLLAG